MLLLIARAVQGIGSACSSVAGSLIWQYFLFIKQKIEKKIGDNVFLKVLAC